MVRAALAVFNPALRARSARSPPALNSSVPDSAAVIAAPAPPVRVTSAAVAANVSGSAVVTVMDAIGAPVALTGLLVPIRESGSMIPQLVIAAAVRRQPVRKWVWVVGSLLQAAAVFAMGLFAWFSRGVTAGLGVVACLVFFSLARGLCSVASKDVIGKTIPKTRRGRVNGISAGIAGLAVSSRTSLLVREVRLDPRHFSTALRQALGNRPLQVAATVINTVERQPSKRR